jgi:ribosome biogenesis protein MAK21
VFLNQLQLSRDDNESDDVAATATIGEKSQNSTALPASLINTYFHLFEMTVKKDEVKKGAKQIKSKDSSSGMKSRLLSALLTGVNRAHPYLPKKDAAMDQHIDALYRISHTAPPAAATQALMLLFQLAVGSGDIEGEPASKDESTTVRKDRFYRALYSKLVEPDMFTGRQLTLFFNLLFRAMKYDTSLERISAFAKRLLHTVLHQSSSIVCGSLFLLSEIVRCHPEIMQHEVETSEVLFDPAKREPRAAFSGKVSLTKNLWELSLLAHHYHPSVSKFTADSGGDIFYKGDPLADFALSPFLDKFAFRNPKSLNKLSKQLKRGESIAERKSGLSGSTALPMNDPHYLETKNISEAERFFHHFFVERAKRDEMKGIVRGTGANKDKDDSDLEDEALNAAEADDLIDDFEGDTDSEEEAFVNKLAEKLMETSGNGKANFDDEDPDMDGWSDFDDDEDNDDNEEDGDNNNNEDAFMDAASSDDHEGENVFGAMEGEDSGSDDGGSLPFDLLGEDGSDDGESPTDGDKRRSKRKEPSLYADAEQYEHDMLEQQLSHQQEHDDSADSAMEEVQLSQKKKKKKSRTSR